jgi:hypothetical protein
MAGWLFADLLLVLFVVTLVSVPARGSGDDDGDPPPPTPTATATPSPSPSPTPAKPPGGPVLVLQEPIKFRVRAPYAGLLGPAWRSPSVAGPLAREVRCALLRRGYHKRRAGFVISFGTAPGNPAGYERGRVAGSRANLILKRDLPTFQGIQNRGYWTGGTGDVVEFEIFFFAPDARYPVAKPVPNPPQCGGEVRLPPGP